MTLVPQSGVTPEESDNAEENAPVQTMSDESIMQCNKLDHTSDVYFGESITSFRQMMKRYNFYQSLLCNTTGRSIWLVSRNDFPLYRGQLTYGINTNGVLVYNNTINTMINYVSSAFLTRRGGLRWKYMYNCKDGLDKAYSTVERGPIGTLILATNTTTPVVDTNPSLFASNELTGSRYGQTGAYVSYLQQQPSIEVELPNYNNFRFSIPKQIKAPSGNFSNYRNTHTITTHVDSTTKPWFDQYVATAEDFTLSGFQGCPPIGMYPAPA
jgi:hypothetical protein